MKELCSMISTLAVHHTLKIKKLSQIVMISAPCSRVTHTSPLSMTDSTVLRFFLNITIPPAMPITSNVLKQPTTIPPKNDPTMVPVLVPKHAVGGRD